jgi:hypothetical protein
MHGRASLLWLTAVAALAVGASGCERHSEESEADEDSLTAPSAASASSPTTAPAATPTPAPAASPSAPPPGGSAVAYDPDVKAVLDARCVRCHSGLGSYRGALNYVRPGDASSVLVQVTEPGGAMARYLGGSAEADLIRQWVVAGAPERR